MTMRTTSTQEPDAQDEMLSSQDSASQAEAQAEAQADVAHQPAQTFREPHMDSRKGRSARQRQLSRTRPHRDHQDGQDGQDFDDAEGLDDFEDDLEDSQGGDVEDFEDDGDDPRPQEDRVSLSISPSVAFEGHDEGHSQEDVAGHDESDDPRPQADLGGFDLAASPGAGQLGLIPTEDAPAGWSWWYRTLIRDSEAPSPQSSAEPAGNGAAPTS